MILVKHTRNLGIDKPKPGEDSGQKRGEINCYHLRGRESNRSGTGGKDSDGE